MGREIGVTLALILSAAACSARRPAVTPPVEDIRRGRSSVRILNEPEVAPGTPDPSSERITPAYASEDNELPVYPVYALKAGCRDGVVPVRVWVGSDGNVTAQRDVPDRPLVDDECHVAFRAAVQSAVKDWRFAPAFRVKPVPGADQDGDGRPDSTRWEQSPITIYLDFEFLFELVEGKGVVRTR